MKNKTYSRLKIERDSFVKDPSEDINAYPVNVSIRRKVIYLYYLFQWIIFTG